jgi:hypothetical protein
MAEGLSSIWKILADVDRSPSLPPETLTVRLEGVIYGIEQITKDIPTYKAMVSALGWQRRRDYESWLDALERLGQFRDVKKFDVHWALTTAMEASDYFRMLRPETEEYFKGLWQRSPKAWTLGYTIAVYAGVGDTYYDAQGDAG